MTVPLHVEHIARTEHGRTVHVSTEIRSGGSPARQSFLDSSSKGAAS
ncbi:hypothetical protein HF877_19980 [Rhodococcus sp. BL-253-APC-6A1W]|nr:hypothetical protein [Rhodococcus sp. BL-253-APC-6A1W]NMD97653.1 hypothetical protein [Rhodococcus sp. BL-253-APC-6A1W]